MAFPNEIQIGRLNSILHKLLDMKEGAPSPSLAPDVFAMIGLEMDRPEWKFLAGERLCSGSKQVAAGGAGTYGNIVLRNPPNSNTLLVVESLQNCESAARALIIAVSSTDITGTYSSANAYRGLRDTRFGVTANAKPSGQLWSLATAAGTSTNILRQWRPVQHELLPFPMILAPGDNLSVFDSVANQSDWVAFMWRERVMSTSERR